MRCHSITCVDDELIQDSVKGALESLAVLRDYFEHMDSLRADGVELDWKAYSWVFHKLGKEIYADLTVIREEVSLGEKLDFQKAVDILASLPEKPKE